MNSLIVACGYYQYDMLNINNLFQNGIITILIPPNCTKYLFCAIITQKLSYVNVSSPIIYLNKSDIGAH